MSELTRHVVQGAGVYFHLNYRSIAQVNPLLNGSPGYTALINDGNVIKSSKTFLTQHEGEEWIWTNLRRGGSVELKERFEALTESQREAILDKHRHELNFDGDWWHDIYQEFLGTVQTHGYEIDRHSGRGSGLCIYFSGFASQGDGACFEGRIVNWYEATKNWPVVAQLNLLQDDELRITWKSRGNYCHSHTLQFDDNFDVLNEYDPSTERIRYLALQNQIDEAHNAWVKFLEHTEKNVRSLCDDLYAKLEEQSDYLSSDETVLESLIANDMLEEELEQYEQESA